MSMTIEWGNIRAVFAFFPKYKMFLQQVGRYHGLYVRAIDPPDTQESPKCRFTFAWHKNEIPNTPEKSLFGGPIL